MLINRAPGCQSNILFNVFSQHLSLCLKGGIKINVPKERRNGCGESSGPVSHLLHGKAGITEQPYLAWSSTSYNPHLEEANLVS